MFSKRICFSSPLSLFDISHFFYFFKGRDGNGQGEHCALFYRCDRMRLLEAGTFWLSETPETEGSRSWNAACNRICSWIVLAMHETPHVKSFFSSAHLDHVSALARSESSALIVRKVQDLCKWFHCANAVVMGDFNTTPEFEPACGGHFVESWLRDAYAEAPDRPKQAGGSFHDFSGVAIASIGRIDWIWIGGFVKSRSAGLYTQKKGKFYPSDHFPVFCNLTIM